LFFDVPILWSPIIPPFRFKIIGFFVALKKNPYKTMLRKTHNYPVATKWRQPFHGHKKTCFRRLLVKSKVFPDCFGLGVAERYQLCPVIRSAAE
ncbi:hypothetical protein, partial [Catellatospora sp. NPDC049133]|uniref:hypothetical protein n=1 Tax=Catellatospora sp. NPDC049133 TaxID=3155499 RepID=UPI0033F1F452